MTTQRIYIGWVMTYLAPVDIDLARRLERAEALASAACIESRRALQPDVGSAWISVAGAYAMYDGASSPLTQTFGIGLYSPFLAGEFEQVEEFFSARGAATSHEVCSFAAHDTQCVLSERNYSPMEASVVLIRGTADSPRQEHSGFAVRAIEPADAGTWSQTAAAGWANEMPELTSFLEELGAVVSRARGVTCFLAEENGEPVAAATLNIHNGVALFAGAATIPEARRRGAQSQLLRSRLAFAEASGVDTAMIVTQPGSLSQRNAERQGFVPVYSRTKWTKM